MDYPIPASFLITISELKEIIEEVNFSIKPKIVFKKTIFDNSVYKKIIKALDSKSISQYKDFYKNGQNAHIIEMIKNNQSSLNIYNDEVVTIFCFLCTCEPNELSHIPIKSRIDFFAKDYQKNHNYFNSIKE